MTDPNEAEIAAEIDRLIGELIEVRSLRRIAEYHRTGWITDSMAARCLAALGYSDGGRG